MRGTAVMKLRRPEIGDLLRGAVADGGRRGGHCSMAFWLGQDAGEQGADDGNGRKQSGQKGTDDGDELAHFIDLHVVADLPLFEECWPVVVAGQPREVDR